MSHEKTFTEHRVYLEGDLIPGVSTPAIIIQAISAGDCGRAVDIYYLEEVRDIANHLLLLADKLEEMEGESKESIEKEREIDFYRSSLSR